MFHPHPNENWNWEEFHLSLSMYEENKFVVYQGSSTPFKNLLNNQTMNCTILFRLHSDKKKLILKCFPKILWHISKRHRLQATRDANVQFHLFRQPVKNSRLIRSIWATTSIWWPNSLFAFRAFQLKRKMALLLPPFRLGRGIPLRSSRTAARPGGNRRLPFLRCPVTSN